MNIFGWHIGRHEGFGSEHSNPFPSATTPPLAAPGMGPHQSDRTYYFGGLDLSYFAAPFHHVLLGATGSGKSLNLSLSMLSIIPPALREAWNARTVIADVKQEMIRFLTRHGVPKEKLIITLPFDSRCSRWALYRDARSRDVGLQVASLLIPESNDINRYFSDAARDMLNMIICLFIDLRVPWQLADLINAFTSVKTLTHVLSHSAEGAEILAMYLGSSQETAMNVFTTARTNLAKYEAAAALWQRAENEFSLEEFLTQRGQTLILGNYQTATYAMGALNRLMLQRLTELTLGLPDVDENESDDPRRIFYFLDEVQRIGAGKKLDFLPDLLTGGRSKGASCFLATQGIEALRCVYTEHETETLLSMAGNIGVLRVSGTQTPDWASKLFGEQEIIDRMASGSTSHAEHTSHTRGWSESFRQTPLFLPGYFRTIDSPQLGKPLYGVFSCSSLGARPYVMEMPSHEVTQRLEATLYTDANETNSPAGEPNFVPWANRSWMKLERWNEADYARLKLKPPPADEGLDGLKKDAK